MTTVPMELSRMRPTVHRARRALLVAASLAAVTATAAGCGGVDHSGDTRAYARSIAPLSRQIERLGGTVQATLRRAPGLTEPQLQRAFAVHADRLAALTGRVRAVDVPDGAAGPAATLTTTLDETTQALRQLAGAAGAGDAVAAARAAGRLTRDADTLRDARLALAAQER
jgi:hypothetical protein